MRDPALWSDIRRYVFPPALAGGWFSSADDRPGLQARLEDTENWAEDYAQNAIEEYRRFVYLARISETEVTPSEVIDRVWHEHIWDTKDYLDGFCARLFGETLHHAPGTGPADAERHARQYEATRTLYEEEFGHPPPPDIWQHRPPDRITRDRWQGHAALAAGLAVGAGTTWALWAAFGWVLSAGFWGLAAGGITTHLLSPKIPGPRYRSTDSDSGGAGCGD